MTQPNVLVLDIETAPLLGYVWGLWNNDIALNQLHSDWHILSYAAKKLNDDEIFYFDQSKQDTIEKDLELCKRLHKLLKNIDILITHNGKAFDQKKINSRFLYHGLRPLTHYRHIDTYVIAKKHFSLTSNKLEYLAKYLKVKSQKLTKREFSGFELWSECLKGNKAAWEEMKKYNILDITVLEQVYHKLASWDNSVSFAVFDPDNCKCGHGKIKRNGYMYTNTGKFQRYICTHCKTQTRDKINLLSKDHKAKIKKGI